MSFGCSRRLAAPVRIQYCSFMLKTVPGTFKAGVVELGEAASGLPEGPVLVTFLAGNSESAVASSLTPEQVAELRGKLAAWEKDWNDPGMAAYDEP